MFLPLQKGEKAIYPFGIYAEPQRVKNHDGKVGIFMQELVTGTSIRYIVELDKKARERVAQARRQAEEIDFEAENKKKQMISEYKENAEESLRIMEEAYRAETDEKITQIEADKNKKIENFDKALSDNRERLADQVFEAVTGKKRRK